MDEQRLAELFRDATDGAPPASFGHADVLAASRQATARHRMAVAGSAVAIAGLVGSIVIGGGYLRHTSRGGYDAATAGGAAVASAPSGPQVQEDQPGQAPGPLAAPPSAVDKNGPEAHAEQGRNASGKVVPWPGLRDDDARAGCGPVDRELADALISELPATPSGPAVAVPDGCPPGARAAALPVPGGTVYVVLAPVAGDGPADQPVRRDDGAYGYFVYTPKGRVLLVLSVPAAGGSIAPYADRTQTLAEHLAPRY